MSEKPPPVSSSPRVADALRALAQDFERSLTPVVDPSLTELADVAFVQGTMNPYDVRGATVPPSTGHWIHLCLNVTVNRLHGELVVELMTDAGDVLTTDSALVRLPTTPSARRRPAGLASFLFPVPASVDWGSAAAAKISFRGE